MLRQGFAGSHQHLVGDPRRAGGDHPQSNTREDIGVIALGDGILLAFHGNRGEWAAGGDQRLAVGPAQDILRRRFHP